MRITYCLPAKLVAVMSPTMVMLEVKIWTGVWAKARVRLARVRSNADREEGLEQVRKLGLVFAMAQACRVRLNRMVSSGPAGVPLFDGEIWVVDANVADYLLERHVLQLDPDYDSTANDAEDPMVAPDVAGLRLQINREDPE